MNLFRKNDPQVEKAYLEAGRVFGDAVSYIYMGECIGFSKLLDEWSKREKEYVDRGYRTISLDAFVQYGGYGKKIENLNEVRDKGEDPIFHSEIYQKMYLGRIAPSLDMNALLKPGASHQVGTYILPSTEKIDEEKKSGDLQIKNAL